MKKVVLGISGGISFAAFLILLLVTNYLGNIQTTQTAARRWNSEGGVSQVSCFFAVGSGISEDRLIEFEHTVDGALTDASVVLESENPSARLWADAYSADGRITLSTDRATLTADAIGIGGDFFLFHPVKLLYGAYFSGNDLMQDYCVIDADAAWQLFGSSDVAGMMVFIGGRPHIVTGVVERPSGRLAEAAGLDSTLVYVSYQTLSELGQCNGINHYEILLPNPVTNFAVNYIRESLGSDEKRTEVVENTSRYSLLSRLKLLTQFGTRSMNGKAVIYPYWENIARGYEDILTLLTLFELLFLLYPAGLAVVFFCIWWRHKGWTLREVRLKLMDKAERLAERAREARKAKKAGKTAGTAKGSGKRKSDRPGEESGKQDGRERGAEEQHPEDGKGKGKTRGKKAVKEKPARERQSKKAAAKKENAADRKRKKKGRYVEALIDGWTEDLPFEEDSPEEVPAEKDWIEEKLYEEGWMEDTPPEEEWEEENPQEEWAEDAPTEEEWTEGNPQEEWTEDAPTEEEWAEENPYEEEWTEDAPMEEEWAEDAPTEEEWTEWTQVDEDEEREETE